MRSGFSVGQNRNRVRHCDRCGAPLSSKGGASAAELAARECASCGKIIDLGVCFTLCPHCGYNYRIEVTGVRPRSSVDRRSATCLYAASLVVPMAGFVIGAMESKKMNLYSQRLANGCVALGAINAIATPVLVMKCLGLV